MAMVRQVTEGELLNGSAPEDDGQSSEPMECSTSRPQSCASSGSKRNSPSVCMPTLQYSKEDLMKYSSYPLSQNRPTCLDPAYNNATGKWDPERWFMNHRNDRIGPVEQEPRSKRERQEESIVSHKRKSSDPKERIKEEKDDIVLSPQRRSFGTGCHVIQQSSLARRPGSPTDARDLESFRETTRRIGSGRIMTRDREQRDWERDREYGYNSGSRNERRDRFDQDDNEKDIRRYSSRYNRNDRRSRGRDRIDEVEPEWFSGGPTSQSETIELVGFEDPHHDDETRKPSKKSGKRAKQNSRRSSIKSEEGEKNVDMATQEDNSTKKVTSVEEPKIAIENKAKEAEIPDSQKTNTGFDLDDLFKIDWIPGLLQNESPPDNANNEIGCSRFSQWFQRESPRAESGNNSRRSSFHEELIVNILNSTSEPQVIIPSPNASSSDNFFAPISPAISHSSNYSAPKSLASNCSNNKDIIEMLQSVSGGNIMNDGMSKGFAKSVKELEADLKRIVLGDQVQSTQHEERSAFDKLLQHMSDSRTSPTTSMSMGPLDKSKVLQEQDILQDILGGSQASISPMLQQFQMFKDDKLNAQSSSGGQHSHYISNNQARSEMLAHLVQQQKHQEQPLQQMHQQQIQNHLLQQAQQSQGFTVDMLAKILGPSSEAPLSRVSPGLHQPTSAPSVNRNDPQLLNSVLQYQRQRELFSSMLKQQQQQQQQQQHSNSNLSQSNLLQTIQRRCPSAKEIPIQQTLGLPTLGLSPRQSPLPPDAINSAISSQGRIPSPLVFGQQPPALSHAPAPIHPAAIVQAMSQNAANPNTLQVQNPVVLQRVPSPQELAVHTQSILQNALIKRKLEEQKENFRKRQEAQRTNSPVATSKNGMTVSPLKVLSPTIAFTPTSVMRKIHSEKTENKEQKISQQNGNKIAGISDARVSESSQLLQKLNSAAGISTSIECNLGLSNSHISTSQSNSSLSQGPRAVHGQAINQPRSIHGMNSGVIIPPGQGRPIVKVGLNQGVNSTNDLSRTNIAANKAFMGYNKSYMFNNNHAHTVHHEDFDPMGKLQWHSQLSRQQNASSVPQLQMAAATYAALNHRPPPALNPHHPDILRPVNIASAGNVPASNINFPLLKNAVQNPIRAQTNPINQLSHLQHLATLQLQQRGAIDSRQLQALAPSQRLHPATLQQLLMNSQNQVTAAAQAQVVTGFPGNRDAKHQHLLPNQSSLNSQSPSNLSANPGNLAKWFGNDVLKQKMPEMPPVSHQKALLVEEVERQQQQSTVVHN